MDGVWEAAGSNRHGLEGISPIVAEQASKKSVRQGLLASVPIPTQVGEESILRRSREPPLRNSAKWVRNFGKRTASCQCFTALTGGRRESAWATVY